MFLFFFSGIGSIAFYFSPDISRELLQQSPYFRVEHIHLTGNQKIPRGDFFEKTGIRYRDSLLQFSASELERKILSLAWVSTCRVRKIFPDSLDIEIVERQVQAEVRQGDEFYLLDAGGHIFKKLEPPEQFDLPVIILEDWRKYQPARNIPELSVTLNTQFRAAQAAIGFRQKIFPKLMTETDDNRETPTIFIANRPASKIPAAAYDPKLQQTHFLVALSLLKLIEERQFLKKSDIASIAVDAKNRIILTLKPGDRKLLLGAAPFDEKLTRFQLVEAQLASADYHCHVFNFLFEKSVICQEKVLNQDAAISDPDGTTPPPRKKKG
jgi:cell division septal protein FtsQ